MRAYVFPDPRLRAIGSSFTWLAIDTEKPSNGAFVDDESVDRFCVTGEIDERYLSLLHASGADKLAHSGRTLLDHLVGTYRLLKDWGNAKFLY